VVVEETRCRLQSEKRHCGGRKQGGNSFGLRKKHLRVRSRPSGGPSDFKLKDWGKNERAGTDTSVKNAKKVTSIESLLKKSS